MNHGQIIGALATVPELDRAIEDYSGVLGFELAERGRVDAALAHSWAAPGVAGARYAALRPPSGAPSTIRLVEQPAMPGYRPTTTFGWNAFEISVHDVFGWPDKLTGTGFEIVGLPREIPGLPYFVAMQMVGRGGEMIYLNEVREDTPTSDLPRAASAVDMVFIVILGTADRESTVAWYRDRLKLDEGGSYTIEYTMINKAFGLPDGTPSTITMAQKGRMPIAEIDQYPPAAAARPVADGMLPPGNALVTLAVESLDALELDWISPPAIRSGNPYDGRRTATVRGPAGELLELVEI
ncbi:Glyoxalase/bleomycin resistance protein/dioxygenase [Sphingomonas antarctica]|uniref:VOC family protein n=1 Tax=Sphingomonas antarctica TaxID=2040274 RepID=UPI0039ECC0FA